MDIKSLLPELKKLVTDLSEDLLARSTEHAEIDAGLREAYAQIEKGGRTAQAFEVWREDYLDQVAVAWVLACVFVRFMEDNHLIDACWLAGEGAEFSPDGVDRRKLAEDTHELYFRAHPHESDREYFEHVFHEVGKIPACRDLFAKGKTPLWAVGPSGDAAMKLLGFWSEIDAESGHLKRSLEVEYGDTRFLGDLYQDLSERARKKYALLQTPVFVEEFILDRTLDPAIDEFGLEEIRMIDPTCGSGHFLLGGFARLFGLWIKREENEVVAAQKALDGVWGVDINPFAVAIARFRLIVVALRACGIKRLKEAPAWHIHLATGDSLLFGRRWTKDGQKIKEQKFFGTDEASWAPEIYACEDQAALTEVLGQQYHMVVGNPPYITVKDKSLNQAYRDRYSACHRQYSLAVPFLQRFFDLCLPTADGRTGYVGQITANSFMKREFGKKLITQFFPKVDLTHVIDTSGAYIPGHGTPTVILLGRNRPPQGNSVRAVLGIKGEPSTPPDPAQGLVWQSILRQIDIVDAEDEFTSTADVPRSTFFEHPWSMQGGGASVLMDKIESNSQHSLCDSIRSIGRSSVVGEDDCWIMEWDIAKRHNFSDSCVPFGIGTCFRDWHGSELPCVIYPYQAIGGQALDPLSFPLQQWLWPARTMLALRTVFGKSMNENGKFWYEHLEHYVSKLRTPLSIAFAFVATHNHFVLDRGGKVFNRSAPIIKLPDDATEEDHLALLGLLNSSTACFWMQQVFHNKGGPGGGSSKDEKWHDFYEFSGTAMKCFPVAKRKPVELTRRLDTLAKDYSDLSPDAVVAVGTPTSDVLDEAKHQSEIIRQQMISLQEELDWKCYELYGLLEGDLCADLNDLPAIALGQRAFEIVMARQIAEGTLVTKWFTWLGIDMVTEIPSHWPLSYQRLVEQRIEYITNIKSISLIERPDCKRRWQNESWEDQQQRALRGWLLDRLESDRYWPPVKVRGPQLQSVAQLADLAGGDEDFMQVAALYRNRPDFDLSALVAELVAGEAVPILPQQRYKPSGLRKRSVWEKTWQLQRREDAGEDVGNIPVQPKYGSADFLKSDFWRLRGKLDVPKERWISFPHCETESDPSLVIGWAGWNHLQQATALVAYYDARKREGWDAKRLTPLLAGLDQLLPWIHQWHSEVDPEFGETAGQSFQTMLEADAHELGLTLEETRAWQPPAKKKGGRRKGKKG